MYIDSTTEFSEFDIFTSNLEDLDEDSKTIVNTINPYSFLIAKKDLIFKKALLNSDILLPDGIGIVAALKILAGKSIKRITGSDLHSHLLQKLNQERKSCFYLGSSQSTLDKIKQRLSTQYPNIKAEFYSPPFVSEFSDEDNWKMLKAINSFCPDVLFIGMTAPKQEKWAYLHKEQIESKIICSVGAVFDFYAGTVIRSGKFWINLGLEWLPRLLKDPKRLWKRSLYYGPEFIYWTFHEKAKNFLYHLYYYGFKRPLSKKVLIIGYNKISKKIMEYVESNRKDINIQGFCEENTEVLELTHYPVFTGIQNTMRFALDLEVDEIYSTISPDKDKRICEIMQFADQECIRFKFFPDFYESTYFPGKHLKFFKDLPVLPLRKEPLELVGNRLIKRAFDVIVSCFVIAFILSWLTPIIALLILIDSPGSVFFMQNRMGRNKRPFRCIKFRSMRANSEADKQQAVQNDPRLTKIGKILRYTSIDEFPQFLNVLLGNMSVIGPRPHMLIHTEEFSSVVKNYPTRHFIKPGITGWAQIKSFRGEITDTKQIEERLLHDMWYLENWSLKLDLQIMLITVLQCFK
jgi:putative colanic acid biosynthesis UDP-glucose lipid carrier transferase